MNRPRCAVFVLAAALLPQESASAQPPPSASPPPPVFRAGVDLVRLDVRVTDAEGHPIRDLRPEEIAVSEGGEPRPILFFQHIEEPAGPLQDVARRTTAGEVSTNRGAPRGHLYVLVFDQTHITPGNEGRARQAAAQFLRTALRPGDRVALFALPGPGPQIDFTARVDEIVAALARVRGSLERIGVGALGAMRIHEAYEIVRGNEEVLTRVVSGLSLAATTTDLPGAVIQRTGDDPTVFRRLVQEDARTIVARAVEDARRFLLALADLVFRLRDIEGRKAVILFSEGFFVDHVTTELSRVAAAAAQAYAVVYGVDLNRRELDPKQVTALGAEQYLEVENRMAALGSLAAETDGVLLNDANGWLTGALGRVAAASQDYYLVGFVPPADALKERARYRRVKVTVTRPGARVSARSGYALDPERSPADRRRAINLALAAPFPAQGLPLSYTTYVFRGPTPGQQRVVLSAAAELPPIPTGEARSADVVFVVRSARDGRLVASGTDTLPLAPRPGGGPPAVTYRVQFELPPGEYLMRVVVREPGGLVGSADRRFEIRPLDGRSLWASDLLLRGGSESLAVLTTVPAGRTLAGVFELFAPTGTPLDQLDVTTVLTPVDAAGGGGLAVPADLGPVLDDGAVASRGVRFDLPLGDLKPGRYLVRAVIKEGGQVVGERVREVEIGSAEAVVDAREERPAAEPVGPREIVTGHLGRRYLAELCVEGRAPQMCTFAAQGAWERVEEAAPALAGEVPGWLHGLVGLARFARGEYAAAATALSRALDAGPRSALAAFFLGWASAAAGDDRQAISAWRQAAYLDPTLVSAHLALADAYERLAQPALAAQALRAGLSALPDSPELLDRLSRLERR